MGKEKYYHSFENIYKQFAEGIFRFIYFKVSDYELTQDLTADSFIRYWKVLAKGEAIENHKAFLYFIAKGLVIDYYRKKKNNKRISLENVDERLLGVIDAVESTLSQKQELEQVFIKIKKLKKDYQEILFLHYVEDLTVKEIAFIQKKKENTIRVLLYRALKSLKEII